MQVKAIGKNIKLSAHKARLVVNQVRSLPVGLALEQLRFSNKKGGVLVKKVLESAIANAENNEGADIDALWVDRAYVDEGRTARRFRARAKGSGSRILKRSCHITISVSDDVRKATRKGR